MKKAINIVKILIYLGTVILPVLDSIRGIRDGIKKGLEDVKNDRDVELLKKQDEQKKLIMEGRL